MRTLLTNATPIDCVHPQALERSSVEVGKLADLIVVGGNPLEDIQNVRQLKLVLKEGVVVSDKRE